MLDTVKKYLKKYFIDAMGAMAQGLFASLLIGTIFNTIGKYTEIALFSEINCHTVVYTLHCNSFSHVLQPYFSTKNLHFSTKKDPAENPQELVA